MRKNNIFKLVAITALIIVSVGAVKTLAVSRINKEENLQENLINNELEDARKLAEGNIEVKIKKNNNDTFVLFKNGNYVLIPENNKNITFTLKKLDKYPFKLENLEELEKIILSSYLYSDAAGVKEIYKTNQYITQSGNNITEFNNGSYAIVNQDKKNYEFIEGETGGWSIYCDSTAELQELIKTYIK